MNVFICIIIHRMHTQNAHIEFTHRMHTQNAHTDTPVHSLAPVSKGLNIYFKLSFFSTTFFKILTT